MEDHDEYEPWGGDDIESATGRQFQHALRDLAHVYGDRWPRLAAAIIAGTIRDRQMVQAVAQHLEEMLGDP